MPIWWDTLLARLAGRKVERHKLQIKVTGLPKDAGDRSAMAREIEAEVARQLSEGNGPDATRAAVEEIARRHGGEIEGFKDT